MQDCYSSPVPLNSIYSQSSKRISTEIDETMENQEAPQKVTPTVQPKTKKLKMFADHNKFSDILSDLQKQYKNESLDPVKIQKAFQHARESTQTIYKFYQFFGQNGWKNLVEFSAILVKF